MTMVIMVDHAIFHEGHAMVKLQFMMTCHDHPMASMNHPDHTPCHTLVEKQ